MNQESSPPEHLRTEIAFRANSLISDRVIKTHISKISISDQRKTNIKPTQ